MNSDDEEFLDLVDDNDQVIGSIERTKAYEEGKMNFRVIDAFIKNSEGKLFIPRRHPEKTLFPLALDTSVGGHVTSGDTYDETFKKEAAEELNINIDDFTWRPLGLMTPKNGGVSNFVMVYEIESDITPNYNPEDFVEHYWLTPTEILERVRQGDSIKGNLLKILQKFYF